MGGEQILPGTALPAGDLLRLLGFAVEGGLIHAEPSRQENAVGGNPFPRLEQHQIPHHDVRDGQGADTLSPFDPALDMTRVLLQLVEGGFAAVFRQSGDKGGQKNGDGNAGGFEPVEMAEEKDDVDGEGRQQDFDNRIAEAGQKLPEETVALFLRQLIAAMLLPGTLHFGGGQPSLRWGRGCIHPYHSFGISLPEALSGRLFIYIPKGWTI